MNVHEFLDFHHVPYRQAGEHHHVREGYIGVDCPMCSPNSGRFRLGLNVEHQFSTCWNCGYLRYVEVLAELTGVPWKVVQQSIGDAEAVRQTVRKRGRLCPPGGLGPLLPAHEDYLRVRGFQPALLASQWHLGGIGLAARLAWRIYIPVHYRGQVVSWTTRAITDEIRSRYISAEPHEESEPLHDLLYGIDHVRHAVIVVEGPADVWRVGPGAVAVMGLAYSRQQVLQLAKFARRVVIFDREAGAQRRARRLCRELQGFPGRTFRAELASKDPGSASEDEIRALREEFLGEA